VAIVELSGHPAFGEERPPVERQRGKSMALHERRVTDGPAPLRRENIVCGMPDPAGTHANLLKLDSQRLKPAKFIFAGIARREMIFAERKGSWQHDDVQSADIR
jgi:hypothetical protein